tara:strand:- start:1579 stop:1764 length:186 start_codon:yes stop_codon:yes gene_type:complete
MLKLRPFSKPAEVTYSESNGNKIIINVVTSEGTKKKVRATVFSKKLIEEIEEVNREAVNAV